MMGIALGLTSLLCLLASGFFSGAEMGLYAVNRVRARLRADSGGRSARCLIEIANDREESVLAVLLWQNIWWYFLTVATSAWLARGLGLSSDAAGFYSAAVLSPLIFVFGDVVPKNWFQAEPDRLMYVAATILRPSVLLLRYTGILWVLRRVARVAARLAGEETESDWIGQRGEIVGLLREGAAEGVLSEEQTEIVERVMRLSSVRVGEIMIPARRVITVPVDTERSSFEYLVRSNSYSRMPVIGRDRRTLMGIVTVSEVLSDDSHGGIEKWVRPALTISPAETAAGALVHLRRERATMAVVIDPRKGFVGLLTLKDVVEEIFGELPAW